MNSAHHKILQGNCLDVLKTLEPESVHCVITSPPYFGLRDYGTGTWTGGDAACDHQKSELRLGANLAASAASTRGGAKKIAEIDSIKYSNVCEKCGAARADEQIGLEKIPDCLAWARQEIPCDDCFVCVIRKVFAGVWRVLRDDGTLWLNFGDSYANDSKWGGNSAGKNYTSSLGRMPRAKVSTGLKPKDLIGIPWRVALALQSDGWTLRQDIIWHKPNPTPESVTDRCTKSHEYIFLLTKSPKYFYDHYATQERANYDGRKATEFKGSEKYKGVVVPGASANTFFSGGHERWQTNENGEKMRNKRSVWTVATHSFPEAHFATFPPKLIEPCILAGTSEKGCCANCGAPYSRIIQPSPAYAQHLGKSVNNHENDLVVGMRIDKKINAEYETVGWRKSCECDAALILALFHPIAFFFSIGIKPCVILDPFSGSGTTVREALKNNRSGIGIELNPEYIEISDKYSENLQVKLF